MLPDMTFPHSEVALCRVVLVKQGLEWKLSTELLTVGDEWLIS